MKAINFFTNRSVIPLKPDLGQCEARIIPLEAPAREYVTVWRYADNGLPRTALPGHATPAFRAEPRWYLAHVA